MKQAQDNRGIHPLYAHQIGKYKLLTKAQESELGARAQKGDEQAIEMLVLHNLRFVLRVARKYSGLGMDFEDLVSEGNQGLLKAARRFDPSRGVKFCTYAAWWIRQAMSRGLSQRARTIRLPVHIADKIYRLNKARAKFERDNGREGSDEELMLASNVNAINFKRIKIACPGFVSMDEVFQANSDGEGAKMSEVIEDTQAADPFDECGKSGLQEDLLEALKHLDKRAQAILKMRFGLGDSNEMTLEAVGLKFNVNRERIRQIERASIIRLRAIMAGKDNQSSYANFIENPIDMVKAKDGALMPSPQKLAIFSRSVGDILTEMTNIIRFPSHINRYALKVV